MGIWWTDELIKAADISEPLLNELKDEDGLVNINHFKFFEPNPKDIGVPGTPIIPHVCKKGKFIFNDKWYPVLIEGDQPLIGYLLELPKKYPIELSFLVRPYCLWAKAAKLVGPTLEQIFKKSLDKREKISSTYLITDDKSGNELAKIDFLFEYREERYFIQMELMRPECSITRYLHFILNNKREIMHLDGSKFEYEINFSNRYSKKGDFGIKATKKKYFKINGNMKYKEVIPITKMYFEIYCLSYLKMREIK